MSPTLYPVSLFSFIDDICLLVASHQTLISLSFGSKNIACNVSDRLSNSLSDGLSNSISNCLSNSFSNGLSVSIIIVSFTNEFRYSRNANILALCHISQDWFSVSEGWMFNVILLAALYVRSHHVVIKFLTEPWAPKPRNLMLMVTCLSRPPILPPRSRRSHLSPRLPVSRRNKLTCSLHFLWGTNITISFPRYYHSHFQQSKGHFVATYSRRNSFLKCHSLFFTSYQSSKSKAAKFSKQAKVFTAKSVKSAKSKGGKSGGKSGKALFQKSNKGYGWWSASGAVSYLNSGSDYTPIGLERKSSASVMHGTGWWIAVVTVVTCAGSLLFWEVCSETAFPAIGYTCEAAGLPIKCCLENLW